jgi:hypothetical protein
MYLDREMAQQAPSSGKPTRLEMPCLRSPCARTYSWQFINTDQPSQGSSEINKHGMLTGYPRGDYNSHIDRNQHSSKKVLWQMPRHFFRYSLSGIASFNY